MYTALKSYLLEPAKVNARLREEWIKKSLLALPRGLRILDAGAGETPYKTYCADQDYISQDFAKYDGTGNGVGLQTGSWDQSTIDIVSDITAIPAPSGSFDVILCTEVLEHIPDPLATLREFDRLLKPGGQLIMTVPFWSATHFAPYHFCTGYNKYFFEEHLAKRRGYAILEMTPSGNFFSVLNQQLALLPGVSKQYGASGILAYTAWIWIAPLALLLRYFAKVAPSSSDLWCFEYFIRAKK